MNRLASIGFLCCWLVAANNIAADGPPEKAKDKIKDLQERRLKSAVKYRDYLAKATENGFFPLPGIPDETAWINQLIESNKTVCLARLDVATKKQDRIKALEEAIQAISPLVKVWEKRVEAGIIGATLPSERAKMELLELEIKLEKVKLEAGGP